MGLCSATPTHYSLTTVPLPGDPACNPDAKCGAAQGWCLAAPSTFQINLYNSLGI